MRPIIPDPNAKKRHSTTTSNLHGSWRGVDFSSSSGNNEHSQSHDSSERDNGDDHAAAMWPRPGRSRASISLPMNSGGGGNNDAPWMSQRKIRGSMTSKLNASWSSGVDSSISSNDHSQTEDSSHRDGEEDRIMPWSTQELLTGRPDAYVGGYDPTFIANYRRQESRKKTIKIDGYN